MNTLIISLFASILMLKEWSLSFRIKKQLNLDLFEQIKIIDCFPCFTFWVSIIVCFIFQENIIYSLATYVVASIIDKLWN